MRSVPAKAQIWYTDFMVGIMIFSIVIVSYFYYVEHTEYSDENLMSTLMVEGKAIMSGLMTRGYPADWDASNVTSIGLTNNDYRINSSKLASFNSWGYEERRGYMHTTKDYYFFMEYLNGTKFNELCTDQFAGCVEWNESKELVQTTRLLIYDHSIVRMVIYLYQQQ